MKRVKILFHDIDGVLNCASTPYSPLGVRGIDDNKVAILKEIIDRTGAKILLISSWKEGWYARVDKKPFQDETANYLDEALARHGLTITGKVKDLDYGGRGQSILEHLSLLRTKGIEIDRFVILDDHQDDYRKCGLGEHLVKTSFLKGGLTQKKAITAIELLSDKQRPT